MNLQPADDGLPRLYDVDELLDDTVDVDELREAFYTLNRRRGTRRPDLDAAVPDLWNQSSRIGTADPDLLRRIIRRTGDTVDDPTLL